MPGADPAKPAAQPADPAKPAAQPGMPMPMPGMPLAPGAAPGALPRPSVPPFDMLLSDACRATSTTVCCTPS